MTRQMVARLAGFHFAETEDVLVELGGFLEIFDLQREVHDSIHECLLKWGDVTKMRK